MQKSPLKNYWRWFWDRFWGLRALWHINQADHVWRRFWAAYLIATVAVIAAAVWTDIAPWWPAFASGVAVGTILCLCGHRARYSSWLGGRW